MTIEDDPAQLQCPADSEFLPHREMAASHDNWDNVDQRDICILYDS